MFKKAGRNELRQEKHARVRRKVSGTADTPRLNVYKSLHHIYAQIIDDEKGATIVAASTIEFEALKSKTDREAAKQVGAAIAKKAKEAGVNTVVFDRSGYKYHGNVAALADAARENGLEF